MITIHDKKDRIFDTIGLGVLYPTSCTISEELNGMYELSLSHPYTSNGVWEHLLCQNIIVAPTPRGEQPFRIYQVATTLDGIQVSARHVFYDLLDNMITEYTMVFETPQSLLNKIKESQVVDMGFTFRAEHEKEYGTGRDFVNKDMNVVAALLEPQERKNLIEKENRSFVYWFRDMLLVRNGFDILFTDKLGIDKGFVMQYGKNILGMTVDEDISEVITRVYPFIKEGAQPYSKGYIDSPYVGEYVYPKVALVDYGSQTNAEAEEIDDWWYEYFVNDISFEIDKIDIPKVNITVDFQMLSRTVEYQKYRHLEEVFLGDKVTIVHERIGFEIQANVISYDWDAVAEKYTSIELGEPKDILTDYIEGKGYVPSGGTSSVAVLERERRGDT